MHAKAARNVLIIVALAAAVAFVPGGSNSAGLVSALLGAGMLALIVLIIGRLYREHRVDVFGLGDRVRAILYGSVALAVFAMAARDRLLDTGLGTLAWLAMLVAASAGLYVVFQRYRAYRL